MDEFEWVQSFPTSSYGTIGYSTISCPELLSQTLDKPVRGSFASFICHVINLERKLRSFSPLVLDGSSNISLTGKILGQGKTFMVRHARWSKVKTEPPVEVALKEIVPGIFPPGQQYSTTTNASQGDWKDILFELRALLHEPIRYHPNLVRLLGIQWGLSPMSKSTFPVLIMEYASFGTMSELQSVDESLSFHVKQKLCYDVGRGLAALHACGIVHGDLKHENVLIFPNKRHMEGVPYTAKLGDFGGSVMDMSSQELRQSETWTWPFQAPEIEAKKDLNRQGLMLTDVYSFGLLIWRAMMDGEGFISLPGARLTAPEEDRRALSARKASDDITNTAIVEIWNYARDQKYPQCCIDTIIFAIIHSLQQDPQDRDLTKAQAALRGISPGHVPLYLSFIAEKNVKRNASDAQAPPGQHGITIDSLQFMRGRYGNEVDLQDNLPGNRPQLDEPNAEEFMFEPENLKKILTWGQQQQMLQELKDRADRASGSRDGLLEMQPTVAAFYVFQCYLLEFGTTFDAREAIDWLMRASADDDSHEDADYLAQASLWRVAQALGVTAELSTDRLQGLLGLSIIRGHRTSLEDVTQFISASQGVQKQTWMSTYQYYRRYLFDEMGSVGMGYFFPKFLTPPWNSIRLNDAGQLDSAIRNVLGNSYSDCLRSSPRQAAEDDDSALDRVYVNKRGHRIVHYVAAMGATQGLRHLVNTYRFNIDSPNQHVDETALISACVGGKLDCALYLLENGADPNGHRHGQEGPLHWLCSFAPTQMMSIASKLVAAGADVELRSRGMRHDVRGIRADWEHIFEIRTTPLGRAVLMNSIDAVKVLLQLGADPLATTANNHRGEYEGTDYMSPTTDSISPFELAAVMTRPDMIAEFIRHVNAQPGGQKRRLLDELTMLDLAHGKKITPSDPLSLQSRLVRCGKTYKSDLRATLWDLSQRAKTFHRIVGDELAKERSRVLCREVALGNNDIVQCLLQLGYDANGTKDFRPIENAVECNHEGMFGLLIERKADLSVTRMTQSGSISLLHICAARPRYVRPGRVIADVLIAADVPVESVDPRSRPPLATAILNHNFDVAQALLDHGANMDAQYPLPASADLEQDPKTASVLVEVLSEHTMRTLGALEFLFKEVDSTKRPDFLVHPVNKISLFHLLAESPHFTQIAQITPRILNLCLDTYSSPEQINYRHPLLGTPLYHAAHCGNKALVERLLARGADRSSAAGPDMQDSVQVFLRLPTSFTPLWAAVTRLDEERRRHISFPGSGHADTWLKSTLVQNLEKIIEMLSETGTNDLTLSNMTAESLTGQAVEADVLAPLAVELLRNQMTASRAAEADSKAQRIARRKQPKGDVITEPLDLSILSAIGSANDEKAIREICQGPEQPWKDGAVEWLLKSLEATSL